jgi:hypothetical protein
MASKFNLSNLAANVMAHAMVTLLQGAMIDIYDGAQPSSADSPLSSINHSLATFQFPLISMDQVKEGVITFGPVSDTLWKLDARASFARVSKEGRAIFDCSVGVSNSDMVINANPVIAGAVAHIVGGATYTVTK